MAGDSMDTMEARKRKLPAWTTSKGGLAAIAGGTLLLASCGAYAALRGTSDEVPTVAEERAEIPVPMPVAGEPHVHSERAADYSIVSVFGGEAFLATSNDLVRVKVGLDVPGLGTITSVEAFPNGGGTVAGTQATLRTR